MVYNSYKASEIDFANNKQTKATMDPSPKTIHATEDAEKAFTGSNKPYTT